MADSGRVQGAKVPKAQRGDSVVMVPLSDFGKAPAPPPRHPVNWREVALGAIAVVAAIGGLAWWIISSQPAEHAVWSGASALDARTQQK
jgi:hypothetical protein